MFGAHFTYEHKPGTKDLQTARFYSLAVSSKEERELEAIRETVKTILRNEGSLHQRELVNGVRDTLAAIPGGTAPGINKVRGVIKRMVSDGDIFDDGHAGSRSYRII
jgi:hypothetical protein